MSEKQEQKNDLVDWFYVANYRSEIFPPAIYKLVARATNDIYLGVLIEEFGQKAESSPRKKFFQVRDVTDDYTVIDSINEIALHQYSQQAMAQVKAYAEALLKRQGKNLVS